LKKYGKNISPKIIGENYRKATGNNVIPMKASNMSQPMNELKYGWIITNRI